MRTTWIKRWAMVAGAGLVAVTLTPAFGQTGGGAGAAGGGAASAGAGNSGNAGGASAAGSAAGRASGAAAASGAKAGGSAKAGASGAATRSSNGASGAAKAGAAGAAKAGSTRAGSTRTTGDTSATDATRASGSTRTSAADTSSTTTRDAAREFQDTTRDARDAVRDTREEARDTVSDARDAARETTRDARDTFQDADTRETRDATREAFQDTRDTARESLRDTREAARDTTRDARETARDTSEDARDTFRDTREEIRETREAGDRFDEARSASADASDETITTRDTATRSADRTSASGFTDPNRDVREVLRDGVEAREREFGEDPYEGRRGPGVGDPQDGGIGQPGTRDTRDELPDARDDASDALREAREDVLDARETARDTFRDARVSGETSTRDAAREFRESYRDAREDFRDAREEARDTVRDTRDAVRDTTRTARSTTSASARTSLNARTLGLTFSNATSGRLTLGNISTSSPFSRFGFQTGDQILSVNGYRVADQRAFFDLLADPDFANQQLQVAVWRDGAQEILTVDPQLLVAANTSTSVATRFDARTIRPADIGLWLTTSSSGRGVVIADIANTGAIATIGFRDGDQILSVNGVAVASQRDFLTALFDSDFANRPVEVAVWRDGQQQIVTVDTAALIADYEESYAVQVDPLETYGVVLDDRYDFPVIWRISPRTPAFYAGLRPGDVIVSWNGTRISRPADLSRLVAQAEAEGQVAIEVSRNRQIRRLELDATEIRSALRPSISGAGDVDVNLRRDRAFDPTGSLPRAGASLGTDRGFDPTGSLPRTDAAVEVDAGTRIQPTTRPGVLPRILGRP